MNDLKSLISKPIGLGTANLQPYLDNAQSKRILYAALDSGVSYFDTSPRYGLSEKFLGDHLPKNDSILIATKVGLDPLNSSRSQIIRNQVKARVKRLFRVDRYRFSTSQAQPINPSIIYDFQSFQNSIERSLRLLKRERLDVLHVHEPENIINLDELLSWINEKRLAGLIRFRGLAIHRVGSNTLRSGFDDDIIWQYSWNYNAIYQAKCLNSIIFGTRSFLYQHDDPCLNLNKFLQANPRAILLTQSSNHRHLKWIKSLQSIQ